MRPRFHFDIVKGQETILDQEGFEVDDLDQAIEAARSVIEEMRAAHELDGSISGWELVIRDARGMALKRLPIV